MESDDRTQARIAQNQSTFRAANENIESAAQGLGLNGGIPFLCECADRRCTAIVRLTLDAYDDIRQHPRCFFTIPGHEAIAVQAGAGSVAAEHAGYVVVEKIGVAGEIAEEQFESRK